MTGQGEQIEARNLVVKIAFGIGALVCLLAGLVIYLFPDWFGITEYTARIVAIAFLVTGACDYLVLRFWDRIVARR